MKKISTKFECHGNFFVLLSTYAGDVCVDRNNRDFPRAHVRFVGELKLATMRAEKIGRSHRIAVLQRFRHYDFEPRHAVDAMASARKTISMHVPLQLSSKVTETTAESESIPSHTPSTEMDDLQKSLKFLEDEYGAEVVIYLKKIINSEAKNSDIRAPEVVSIAYIVLERVRRKYQQDVGSFKNYAIKSLKNEFLRYKFSSEASYDSFVDEDGNSTFQAADNRSPFTFQETPVNLVEEEMNKAEIDSVSVILSATSCYLLSPLEKALVYITYYATSDDRKTSIRGISISQQMSYYTLLSSLKAALQKLRAELTALGYHQDDFL